MFNLMDVTLRESSYVEGNSLTHESYRDIVGDLHNANIDCIEIGYLGEDNLDSGIYKCDSVFLDYLTNGEINGWEKCFSIMIQPEHFYVDNIDVLKDPRIGMVRLTVNKHNLGKVKQIIEVLTEYDVIVSANITRCSRINLEELKFLVTELTWTGADVIYLADSNGAMLPDELREKIKVSKSIIAMGKGQKLGFHAHNHLGMAVYNSLVAIESGCSYIDGSLLGYGKSSGNLPIETFIALLSRKYFIQPWNVYSVLKSANALYLLASSSDFYSKKIEGAYIGMKNLNLDEIKNIYTEEKIDSLLDRKDM